MAALVEAARLQGSCDGRCHPPPSSKAHSWDQPWQRADTQAGADLAQLGAVKPNPSEVIPCLSLPVPAPQAPWCCVAVAEPLQTAGFVWSPPDPALTTLCSGAPAPVAAVVPRLLTLFHKVLSFNLGGNKNPTCCFPALFKVRSIPFMSEVAFLKAAFSLSSVLVPSAPSCPCSSLARHAEQQRWPRAAAAGESWALVGLRLPPQVQQPGEGAVLAVRAV